MKKNLFWITICFQILVMGFLGSQIINKKRVSVNTISKNIVQVKGTQSLKYFYDLKENIVETQQFDWLSEKAVYTFNKDALNERFDYSNEKPEDTFRIITLGDSFTFGALVDTKYNWTEVLEDKLNNDMSCKKYKKIEVINLGVYGYDIEYAVERYRIRGQKYNPDLILWMLTDNRRILEKRTPLLNECLKNKGNRFEEINGTISIRCYIDTEEQTYAIEGVINFTNLLIDNFNRIFDFFNKNIIAVNLDGTHDNVLRYTKNKTNIFNLDYADKKYLKLPDGHPNKEGHQYFANSIYDYIMRNGIIPCD